MLVHLRHPFQVTSYRFDRHHIPDPEVLHHHRNVQVDLGFLRPGIGGFG
jgi:hypothetical protein